MKIQDLIFIAILIFLIIKNDAKLFVFVGLIILALSIPLFAFWIFFTAEKLVWYAWLFILIGTVCYCLMSIKNR